MKSAVVRVEGTEIVSTGQNYQAYAYDTERNVCTPFNQKTRQKWQAVEAFFPQLVKGRSFLDIGACLGFFNLKALEHGATLSIGLEADPQYYGALRDVLKQMSVPHLNWVHAHWPTQHKADVVMMLSLVHHLFPQMSMKGILRELHCCAGQFVIFEWVGRDDQQVKLDGRMSKYPNYSLKHFLKCAQRLFKTVEFKSYGHHKTRDVYLLRKH